MADTISQVTVTTHGDDQFKMRWGTSVYDYALNGVAVDFQDLMVAISEHRATAVEGEVTPLSTRMRKRNTYLEELGSALSAASSKQAEFKSDDAGSKVMDGWFSPSVSATINKVCPEYINSWNGDHSKCDATKAGIEGIISKLKSVIDGENNAAQSDMTRLQSLVDRRDESFNTATTLMTSISDTRDNAIRNL